MSQRNRAESALLAAVGAVLLVFLAAPILALFVTARGADVLAGLQSPLVWPADLRAAQALSILLVVVAFVLMASVRSLLRRSTERQGAQS
jgi:molybdate transport system permease protein